MTAPRPPGAERSLLDRLVSRARLSLTWEFVWPPLAWALTIAALFLTLSWAGFWLFAPVTARIIVLAVFALALATVLAPLVRFRRPTRDASLRRLDRDSRAPHTPATAFEDRLSNGGDDAETAALWALHRARAAKALQATSVAPPSPGMAFKDPRALRFAALLMAVAAFLLAGPQRYARLAAAFDFRGASPAVTAERVDAWIDPPTYTGAAPIVLKIADQAAPENLSAPEDSQIVLRAASNDFDGAVSGGIAPVQPDGKPQALIERRYKVTGDGEFRVTRNGARIASFIVHAVPAGRPTIELLDPPKVNLSGSLALHYKLADPYGVASAEASFDSQSAGKHRLVEPPRFGLSLPNAEGGVGEARTTSDLSEHAWAGAEVTMTLTATDLAGHIGQSVPVKLKLPQRLFVNPLAKALVELRRDLILDPDTERNRVLAVLAGLAIAPATFQTTPSVYLGLHAAHSRLEAAVNDPQLIDVAELLWSMALQIENGDASTTLKDLRAAEQKLREALKNGASEDEIRDLTKQLRELAERYMNEMAQNATPKDGDEDAPDAKDLDAMLDQLEENARNGAKEDAEAMLDELQDMMENMRGSQSAEEQEGERQMRKQLKDLDKLLRDQQALRDDTFRHDQRQRQRRAHPQASPDKNEDDADKQDEQSLQQRQQALRERLEELKRKLKSQGMKGEKGFDDADGDMKEAEGDLDGQEGQPQQSMGQGQGQGRGRSAPGDAVEAQGRALEALRNGAQGLQQQMQANGQGKGQTRSVRRGQGKGQSRDPLGRDQNGQRGTAEGLLHEGPEGAKRARQVLQELRRRLADPNRAQDERDYFERLLKPE